MRQKKQEMTEIKGIELSKSLKVTDLVNAMGSFGLQASQVSKASSLIQKMKKEKARLFLAFTSNMASSGIRELIAQMVKNKFIDAIITTIGAIEEDIMKTHKPFLLGNFDMDDKELHQKGINRIGNILVPNDRYEFLEKHLQQFFASLQKKQQNENKLISPRQLVYELGKTINDKNSFVYWASKNNIPVFCPGITDGALGLNLYFFKQKNPDFGIDVTEDMKELANLVLHADKAGAIILGGGIAKHHTIGVNILRDGLDYAVYISTGTEYDGSLSGARPKEAISWSKITERGNHVFVEGDASIIFPLVLAGAL